jgi:hypothetical protein
MQINRTILTLKNCFIESRKCFQKAENRYRLLAAINSTVVLYVCEACCYIAAF